ncbi:MAG TPA: ATP-binding protein [Thermodesulfovibrionales bacterium]|nr:ATP-binding protein [Thermodesulfovibrionales bacterium]
MDKDIRNSITDNTGGTKEAERNKPNEKLEQRAKERADELSLINEKLWYEIVERKRAEDELREALSLLSATLESTADGIIVLDRVGKTRIYNSKFREMWNIPESVLASDSDENAIEFVSGHLKDPAGYLKEIKQLHDNPDRQSFDVLTLRDGRIFERYSQPQRIGKLTVGRVWSFRDITEQRRAEDALRKSEQMLLQAHKMEAIGRLAAGVGHEINNPLAIINEKAGLMNDLLSLSDDLVQNRDTFLHLVKGIFDNVDRCRKITHRLLGFSKKTDAAYKPMDLNVAVKEALEFADREIVHKSIVLKLDMGDALPEIVADKTQLQQVLLNIINNAIDAVERKGVISVSTARKDANTLQVSIRDNGSGIHDETLKHIFEPFFTTKSREKGTGLGLSISYGIIQKLGGTIHVSSDVNVGTTFVVEIPLKAEPHSESKGVKSPPAHHGN